MENSIKQIPFNLRKISVEQFAIIDNVFSEDAGKVNISTGLAFGLDKDTRMIAVFVKINFLQNEKLFLILETACHFQIENPSFESFINAESDRYTIPNGFASHLAVISVGTARGILHAKTENSPLNRFMLPPINLTELIKEDVVL